ncbi:MAG: hypothetical protein A2Y66_02380 [Nitrospirae bacterium RBG_13_41_22]|jgi:hypothetical protein|nr:MAG: hypothetical protein A2Y66_02380 [Nitrospirae bacterium RBG_13_41_22]
MPELGPGLLSHSEYPAIGRTLFEGKVQGTNGEELTLFQKTNRFGSLRTTKANDAALSYRKTGIPPRDADVHQKARTP